MELILILIVLLVVVSIFYSNSQGKKETETIEHIKDVIRQLREEKYFFDRVRQNGKMLTIPATIALKSGEEAYLEENVALYETRAARVSDRTYLGTRVGKRVYVGGSSGTSRSVDELRKIDTGSLFLTNKRIIFNGEFNTRTIDIEKIVSIELYGYDGINIAIENKDKSQIYFNLKNQRLWGAIFGAIKDFKLYEAANKMLTKEHIDILIELDNLLVKQEAERAKLLSEKQNK